MNETQVVGSSVVTEIRNENMDNDQENVTIYLSNQESNQPEGITNTSRVQIMSTSAVSDEILIIS